MTLDLEILHFKNIKLCQETRRGFHQVGELGLWLDAGSRCGRYICGRVASAGRSNQRKNLEDGPGRRITELDTEGHCVAITLLSIHYCSYNYGTQHI